LEQGESSSSKSLGQSQNRLSQTPEKTSLRSRLGDKEERGIQTEAKPKVRKEEATPLKSQQKRASTPNKYSSTGKKSQGLESLDT